MKILLITQNATIEKLFLLSGEKKGFEVFVSKDENIKDDNFDFVFIDDDLFISSIFDELKSKLPSAKFVLIVSKNGEYIEGFDDYLNKPFIPTDLLDLIDKLNKGDNMSKESDNLDIESFEDLDLEDLDVDSDEKVESNSEDDLNVDLDSDELNLDDLDLEQSHDSEENLDLDDEDLTMDNLLQDSEIEDLDELSSSNEAQDDLNLDIEDFHKEDSNEYSKEVDELSIDDLDIGNENEKDSDSSDLENDPIQDDLDIDNQNSIEEDNKEVDDLSLENLDLQEESNNEEAVTDDLDIDNENSGDDLSDLESVDDIDIKENENSIDIENKEIQEHEEDLNLDELSNLNETELAKALGEEIKESENKSTESLKEDNLKEDSSLKLNEDTIQDEENSSNNLQDDINQKTLGNILNINWEELKKAKAKVTITIDFGG